MAIPSGNVRMLVISSWKPEPSGWHVRMRPYRAGVEIPTSRKYSRPWLWDEDSGADGGRCILFVLWIIRLYDGIEM